MVSQILCNYKTKQVMYKILKNGIFDGDIRYV